MNVNIEDKEQLISYVFLSSTGIVTAVVNTPEWKENQKINCEVLFNGIKLDGGVLENALKEFVDKIEEYYKEKYDVDNLDKTIEARALELLKEHADNALEKIYSLTNKLQEADDLLVPYWERIQEKKDVGS